MKPEIEKGMTPRQRCAVRRPVSDSTQIPHTRHRKRDGGIETILTFDVAKMGKEMADDPEVRKRAVDGWFGVWHGRVSMIPVRHVDKWPRKAISRAKVAMPNLLRRVGIEGTDEVHNGADLHSIHAYKFATEEEMRHSMKVVQERDAKEKTE